MSTTTTSPQAMGPRHPVLELLARYKAVFQAAWAVRHELAGPKRLADEAAFLPAALSLQETPVHPAPRRTALVICALFLIALVWSIVGEIDIVAVGQGRIVVSERTKVIQPLETSVIKNILVKDGDAVQAGQVLVELDSTVATADQSSIEQQLASASSEAARTAALLKALEGRGAPRLPADNVAAFDRRSAEAQLDAEWSDIRAKVAKLDAEHSRRSAEIATVEASLAKLNATLPLVRQREADFKSLADQGFVAGHANQDRTRERIELERDLVTQQARLAEARATLAEAQNAKAAYLAETRRALNDRWSEAGLKQSQLTQESAKARQRTRLTQLTAPVAGTVQQLAVHTPGGVATEAQPLMVIVPHEAEVTAEVVIDNKDIGFVNAGQLAEVKLETFNFTKYGTVPAEVSWVTADAVEDEKRGAIFPATLRLTRPTILVDGKLIRLSPGMNLTAEIKTGKRRVIEYLLSPIQRTMSDSLTER
ncbi:HlyD family type I secretion periplasmic adaptor subunit [Caldimonas brevitalea]|uniref:Membrane fusion protein (MFP) family protein n=1 Tax=Caldimonas brevitalea TaxID=413882 RepID=A0A0G3BJZ5_9BURK|nr:HlyD family type I secretion periplasmic adaptor subunit [Caldimonas brevitalea]AKJ26845.1 hemolysin activation protein [Caldimonas brevitalea]